MTDSTVLRDNDGKVYTNILDFMCQKCDLSQEEAEVKYEGYSGKKKAKMHNLHQEEMIELLQEKEAEDMSEEAYAKHSEFYFSKFEGKPNLEMVKEGRAKAEKRYQKLKLHEKWFIHRALIELPEELKQLKMNQEQMGRYIEEWKTKYDKLKEEKDTMAEENKKSKKEIKKLKKMLKDKSTMVPVQDEEVEVETKSPKKRKNSNSEDPEKVEKKRRKIMFDTAPTKPPGNALGLYVREHKDSGKPYDELKKEFNRLTDDDKRNLKVQQKEENLKYYEDMQQWLNGLTVEDRQAYEESKMHNKGLKMPPKMKLEDYFPDLPSPPPTGYFFMCQERKNEIEQKVQEETEATDHATLFKVRAQVSKTMWDEMSAKKKKSLDKKLKARMAKYEDELEKYLSELDGAKRCKYDELKMEKNKWKPEWLENEPKAPLSAYSYYSSKMKVDEADQFAEMSMIEKNKTLAKMWRELSKEKKGKFTKNFEKAKAKHSTTHGEWLSSLNEHQQELYHKLQAAKKATGAKPLVDSANMARDLLAKMDAVPENEQFDIFTLNEEDCNRIRDMYYESVGIKIKKLSTRKTKWAKIMADQQVNEIRNYLKELSKRKKVSIKATKDDREPEADTETVEIPNPPATKKSFKKRMAEYGPGHPERPKTAFIRFKAMMKKKGITDSKEVSKLYKTDSEDVRECKRQEKEALNEYKENVTAWVETLAGNKRALYEANEMRKAKKSDPNNKSQIMLEAGTENLDYLDLQPKTPAAPQITETSDDEDED